MEQSYEVYAGSRASDDADHLQGQRSYKISRRFAFCWVMIFLRRFLFVCEVIAHTKETIDLIFGHWDCSRER